MNVLMIGGTGTISSAITQLLAKDETVNLTLINRGSYNSEIPENVNVINTDINDEEKVTAALGDMKFDAVCEFIGFVTEQVERDYRLFKDRTKQYIYISSASAYNKPVRSHIINEGTTLANPYWEYSRNKIACEELLMKLYREEGFPATIVRPSHTYGDRSVPLAIHGRNGSWQVIRRMLEGKPVLVHGDGTSLWTMTHNSDFAKGFVGLIGNPHAIGEAFQITSDETLTWNQVHQCIADALGVEFKPYYVSSQFLADVSDFDLLGSLIGDKAASVVFDNSKLKKAVPSFKATMQFERGVRQTIDYVLKHEELQTADEEFDAWCDNVIRVLEKAKGELNNV